jgi:hypothetical protein
MQSENTLYSLKTIFKSILKTKNKKAKKRLIFDQAPLGGIPAKLIIFFMLSLPFILFIGLFNPAMFEMLGIAQAVIFFVVFLSMIMILVTAIGFINNTKVIRKVTPSWEKHFPDVDLRLCLKTSGTPYKEFFKYYNEGVEKNLSEDAFKAYLAESFTTMENENKELSDAIKKNRNIR